MKLTEIENPYTEIPIEDLIAELRRKLPEYEPNFSWIAKYRDKPHFRIFGGEYLGDGVCVGKTIVLQNTQIKFKYKTDAERFLTGGQLTALDERNNVIEPVIKD